MGRRRSDKNIRMNLLKLIKYLLINIDTHEHHRQNGFFEADSYTKRYKSAYLICVDLFKH